MGHRVTDIHEDVEGRMPTVEEAQRLDVAPGVPLMMIKQTFYAGDLAVEAADIMIPADRYTLSYRMRVE
ncbi:UTRA domain-containing protein [Murinocardiopsis flavida]|nr:UTRA domain-containing protein [Murinocardiopsis flavida]